MKLVLIRHGEPNYATDSLTEKGVREATLLAKRVAKMDVKEFYVSPLGRARQTCEICLRPLGRTATLLPWVEEYKGSRMDPATGKMRHAWDFYPGIWTKQDEIFTGAWEQADLYRDTNCMEAFRTITDGVDALLLQYGYQREGRIYRNVGGSKDTIVIFCHMIATFSIVSHLTGISAPLLWHGFFAAPTSVTMLQTEERIPGEAWFRVRCLGDVSHLLAGGEPVSDSGFFPD